MNESFLYRFHKFGGYHSRKKTLIKSNSKIFYAETSNRLIVSTHIFLKFPG